MIETATFPCSICDEPSHHICVYCTKDACRNHRCVRCLRCSDCCDCESPLTSPEPEPEVVAKTEIEGAAGAELESETPATIDEAASKEAESPHSAPEA